MVRVVEVNGYKIEPRANLEGADLVDANLTDAQSEFLEFHRVEIFRA